MTAVIQPIRKSGLISCPIFTAIGTNGGLLDAVVASNENIAIAGIAIIEITRTWFTAHTIGADF